jgi:hypothetical protein
LFFRHSLLPGANDEKTEVYLNLYPGRRRLRSLTPGYHLAPFQGFEMVTKSFRQSAEAGLRFQKIQLYGCRVTATRAERRALPCNFIVLDALSRNDAVEKGSTRLWRVVCGVSPQTSSDKFSHQTVKKMV